jgi:hypothetical protein
VAYAERLFHIPEFRRFFRLEEDDVLPEPLSVGGLKMNMSIPMDITNTSVWSDVVHQGKCNQYDKHFDISCLQEAYFAIQTVDVYAICTSGSRRYLKYRTCATDFSVSDMSKAMVIFGHKAEFYRCM